SLSISSTVSATLFNVEFEWITRLLKKFFEIETRIGENCISEGALAVY
ncbi:20800_t:CDS:1, partial [Racocetra persica]